MRFDQKIFGETVSLAVPPPPQGQEGSGAKEDVRDWREYFAKQLRGEGLEIGALHRPLKLHEKAKSEFVDRMSVPELRLRYPELADEPFVEPHIIENGETLASIPSGKYDFLVASHVLEYLRNPVQALQSWLRVLKPTGVIYLIVNDKRFSSEKNRPRTNLEHLLLDFYSPSEERDFDHLLEYAVEVLGAEGVAAIEEARFASMRGAAIPLHVFSPEDLVRLIHWFRQHVAPVDIEEGPVKTPAFGEFHLLLRKG